MRSLQRIFGMVVIMLFLNLAFVTAFWAVDRERANESLFFDVVVLLFTGEGFISAAELGEMDVYNKWMVIALTVAGIFVFIACAMNVFVEVLADSYDEEQRKMVCTCLHERARILADLTLRPYVPCLQRVAKATSEGKLGRVSNPMPFYGIAGMFIAIVYLSVLYVTTEVLEDCSEWVPALVLTAGMVSMQIILRSTLAEKWEDKYLWLCFRVGLQDRIAHAVDDHEETHLHGRTSRLRWYIRDQCRSVTRQFREVEDRVLKRLPSMQFQTNTSHTGGESQMMPTAS
eukprot:CAMPEP_0178373436 /NCGR_PEP_ID=MMETSP0689_2-20121128/1862_1 /TAXON_ID=160604 /ORGANISM="Amphidinium massartii, Strain CS-259" /LENGTH=286 /DNA_ID=CAMNT_0019993379 /DNA_START=182 /DNA_END=1039 /DNA_ORIENTATION=-